MGLDGIGTFLIPLGSYARNRLDLACVDHCAVLWGGQQERRLLVSRREKVFGSGRQMWPMLGFEEGVVAPLGHEKQDLERVEPGPAAYLVMPLSLLADLLSQPGHPCLTFLTLPLVVSRLLFWKLTHQGKVLWEALGQRCWGRGKRTGLNSRSSKGEA